MKQDWKKEDYEGIAALLANMVYGYQGSDPSVQAKQVGLEMAGEELQDLFHSVREEAIREERERIIKEIENLRLDYDPSVNGANSEDQRVCDVSDANLDRLLASLQPKEGEGK